MIIRWIASLFSFLRLHAEAPDGGGATDAPDAGVPDTGGADAPAEEPAGEPTLRDELEAAFDAQEQPAAERPADRGDGRDPRGRFAPRTPAEQAADAQAAQPHQDEIKPPPSWRPEVRGEWAKLPLPVRNEIVRREVEIDRGLREASSARGAVQALQQTISPFQHNIQAGFGGDAVGMIGTLLNADNVLRHGVQSEKCKLLANLIQSYGIDIVALDQTLAGQTVQQDPQEAIAQRLRAEMDQRMQPVMGYFQQMQQRDQMRQQQLMESAYTDVETFGGQPGHEHFEEVREEMADLMEVAAKRGISMTIAQAYDRALALDPRFANEVQGRHERQRVTAAAEAAQRAKRAAVSLPSGGAPRGSPNATASESVRSDIEAAWDQAATR